MKSLKERTKDSVAIQAINNNKIYVYTIIDLNGQRVNDGWLKVGQTIRLSDVRIKEQIHTAGLKAEILYEVSAQDINGNNFTDYNIHNSLVKIGFTRKEGLEWFSINYYKQPELLFAIKSVIEDRINCRGDFAQLKHAPTQFKLRPNQQEAVDKTYARWKVSQGADHDIKTVNQFLWNAKPRFGKTLTAYEFAKKIQAKKVLIVTQRTAISDSWHKDYYQWVRNNTNYKFGSSKENQLRESGKILHSALSKAESVDLAKDPNEDLIFYISFADIKGKEQQEYKSKNQWLFEIDWDLFIIDETHEGSDTDRAIGVFERLSTKFTLHLSGTPFKKIVSKDFNDKNTYTWSYADEQERKNNWDYTEGDNPYAEMPKLNIFTYQLSQDLRKVCMSEEYSFDFNEFFKNDGSRFIHEDQVLQFLDNLANLRELSDGDAQYYPFADSKTRDQLRHTFWLLPQYGGVKMCELLKKLLKQHSYFSKYDVIMAAGSGDDDRAKTDKALQEVEAKIGKQPWKTQTITLSCGQLTTGITVPSWTAVLMMNNLTSPAPYLQAAFRAQNPWRYDIDGDTYNKTDCYVFDFAPDRILKIVDDYANLDATRHVDSTRKQNIRKLINYLPVLSLDRTGQMSYLDAADVLEMPHYYDAKDIVENGFMSNRLFNIGNIFSMPKDKREQAEAILNQMNAVKNKKIKKNEPPVSADDVNLPTNIAISESPLGERQYEVTTTNEKGEPEVTIIPEGNINEIEIAIGDSKSTAQTKAIKQAIEEIKSEKPKVQSEEEKQRDRLRGFSRTIPMFLMAYGKNTTTLANFDEFVNAQVFEELAGITRDQFRVLRDDCQFFNESRFNAAIKEFLEHKKALRHYYKDDSTDDIFDLIPPQDTNQIFTPKRVVNMQLDALEETNPLIFKNPHNTFFDPQMKSGQYITEIMKRLYKYSKDKDIERIITTQVYGLAPTKILTDITHEYIFGFAELKDKKKYQRNFVEQNLLSEDVHGKVIIKQDDGLQNVIQELWGDMKFDAVVGNPPYQEEAKGGSSSDDPVYHHFMEASYALSDKVCLITPARFLFSAGKTPKKWNSKMLNDKHLKVERFEQKSSVIFPNTDIKGGVVITYRDSSQDFGAIGAFVHFNELRSALHKVEAITDKYLDSIITGRNIYRLTNEALKDHPELEKIQSKGHKNDIGSGAFKILKDIVFFENKPNDNEEYVKVIGLLNNQRTHLWIKRKYLSNPENFERYKIILPKANGTGAIGEVLSTPLIGEPLIGYTDTFISVGAFKTIAEAEAAFKYVKSKLARAMLGVLKITQVNAKFTWAKVPLQDFTAASDINWSKSIPEIDRQLYVKYNLSEKEIDFIETRVRAME